MCSVTFQTGSTEKTARVGGPLNKLLLSTPVAGRAPGVGGKQGGGSQPQDGPRGSAVLQAGGAVAFSPGCLLCPEEK